MCMCALDKLIFFYRKFLPARPVLVHAKPTQHGLSFCREIQIPPAFASSLVALRLVCTARVDCSPRARLSPPCSSLGSWQARPMDQSLQWLFYRFDLQFCSVSRSAAGPFRFSPCSRFSSPAQQIRPSVPGLRFPLEFSAWLIARFRSSPESSRRLSAERAPKCRLCVCSDFCFRWFILCRMRAERSWYCSWATG
jgi:hypothetical protein